MKEFASRFYVAMHNASGALVRDVTGGVVIDTNRVKVRGEAIDIAGSRKFTILELEASEYAVGRAERAAALAKRRESRVTRVRG